MQTHTTPTLQSSPHAPKEKLNLNAILTMAAPVCKTYGLRPEDIENMTEGLSYFLRDLPMGPILQAIEYHVNNENELPTNNQIRYLVESKFMEESHGE